MDRRSFFTNLTGAVAAYTLLPISIQPEPGVIPDELPAFDGQTLDLYANYTLVIKKETFDISMRSDPGQWVEAVPGRTSAEVRAQLTYLDSTLGNYGDLVESFGEREPWKLRLHREGEPVIECLGLLETMNVWGGMYEGSNVELVFLVDGPINYEV